MTINTLDQLFEKGGIFPPYPQDFIIPEYIRQRWEYIPINAELGNITVPKLLMESGHIFVTPGDRFNTIVGSRKRKSGGKTPFRIYQFRDIHPVLYGHIVTNSSGYNDIKFTGAKGIGNKDILNGWQELRSGIVVRVQVLYVGQKNFYCVALRNTFDQKNIEDNLINCNYEGAK
jgi:hypothetical protein